MPEIQRIRFFTLVVEAIAVDDRQTVSSAAGTQTLNETQMASSQRCSVNRFS